MDFFTTGQAARELGIPNSRIRQLAEANLIPDAIQTETGRWMIPATAVQTFKQTGIPQIPHTLPRPSEQDAETSPPQRKRAEVEVIPPGLYAPPSQDLIASVEEVLKLKNMAEAIGFRKQIVEQSKWFDADTRKTALERKKEDTEAQEADRLAAAEKRRATWLEAQVAFGIKELPWETPTDVLPRLPELIRANLEHVSDTQDLASTQQLVIDAVRSLLEPFERKKMLTRVVEGAVQSLPFEARRVSSPWAARATTAAWTALDGKEQAPQSYLEAAAILAVQAIKKEFEHQQHCDACIAFLRQSLPKGHTNAELERAVDLAKAKLENAPQGMSRTQIDKLVAQALIPLVGEIGARFKNEAERKQSQDGLRLRDHLVNTAGTILLMAGLTNQERETVTGKLRAALANKPADTPESVLTGLRNAFIEKGERRHAKLQRCASLADATITRDYGKVVSGLKQEGYTFEPLDKEELRDLRAKLIEELNGDESPEDATDSLEELVCASLRIIV